MTKTLNRRVSRHRRITSRLKLGDNRLRLAVFRSNKHIYAQIIDDRTGRTVVAGDDRQFKQVKDEKEDFAKVNAAKLVGRKLAADARAKKITQVAFDRGGYRYAGRVAALADGARAGGLEF